MNPMKPRCIHCFKEVAPISIKRQETLVIRGDKITVEDSLLQCPECQGEFDNVSEAYDMVAAAYKLYRQKHNFVQPEEIIKLRKNLGLTQAELSVFLGFGQITIHRYEKGALQDKSHDTLLKLAMTTQGMASLLETSGYILPEDKMIRIYRDVVLKKGIGAKKLYEDREDAFTGNRPFAWARFEAMVSFLCGPSGQWRTKLNKLLFYADFLNFKSFGHSISGLRYIHHNYGPVPEWSEFLFGGLSEAESFEIKEEEVSGQMGEKVVLRKEPDLSLFTHDELEVLKKVKKTFGKVTSRQISDLSHEEEAYIATSLLEPISYDYAHKIKNI